LEKFIRYMHESSFKITGLCITHQEIGFATIQALRCIALTFSPYFQELARAEDTIGSSQDIVFIPQHQHCQINRPSMFLILAAME
jgi:hypothetical protein